MDVFKQNILSYINESARGNLYRHLVDSLCLQFYLFKPIDFEYKKFITVISACVAPSPDFCFLRRLYLLLVLAYHVLSNAAGSQYHWLYLVKSVLLKQCSYMFLVFFSRILLDLPRDIPK